MPSLPANQVPAGQDESSRWEGGGGSFSMLYLPCTVMGSKSTNIMKTIVILHCIRHFVMNRTK